MMPANDLRLMCVIGMSTHKLTDADFRDEGDALKTLVPGPSVCRTEALGKDWIVSSLSSLED